MLKIYNTDVTSGEFSRIDTYEVGSWVNLVNPTEAEIDEVVNALGIKKNFIMSIIDDDEKPRIDEEDGVKMLLLDVPVYEIKNNTKTITTLPIGILVVRNDYIVTVCLQKYSIIDEFTKGKVKEFYTYKKSRFIIQMIYKLALLYLKVLRETIVKLAVNLSRLYDLLIIRLCKTGSLIYQSFFKPLFCHLIFCHIFRVSAQHNISTASRHIRGYRHGALFTRLSYDGGLFFMMLGVEHLVLYTALCQKP